jgi:hypothetical protein
MTNQDAVTQTLERAQALLSDLIEHRDECEPVGPGVTELRNMQRLVTSIGTRIAESADDVSNVIKRLRDFANTIGRLKGCNDQSPVGANALCTELIDTFRSASDQLALRV